VPVAAIVVAAGSGERFGARKQFSPLAGRPAAAHAVAAARTVASVVVLVVPADALEEAFGADRVVAGGATRSDSVRAGLAAVGEDADVIVVHDAARPAASTALFRAVLEALARDGVDGAVPGLAVTDTLKRVGADGGREVVETLDRDLVVAVQTPQAFEAVALRRAHASGAEATDDAALVEAIGGRVVVVPGEPTNRKLTTSSDLEALAAALGSASDPSTRSAR
jgi:2-C-methyl-D-erythritol 4-phosphate cytidylyltransferase